MMKDRRNRREFMGLTGAGIAVVAGGLRLGVNAEAAAAAEAQDADLVVVNAKVYTVDPSAPRAASSTSARSAISECRSSPFADSPWSDRGSSAGSH